MTAATAGLPANVSAYLAQLRAELDDLAADERDDLLAEVEASLLESAGDEPLAAQFGPPAAFAADLRASAGLPPKPASKPQRAPRLALQPVVAHMRVLAPIWWALRGYIAVAAFAVVNDQMWFASQPAVPKLGGGPAFSVIVIGAAVAVSVGLGLWGRMPRGLAIAANLLLAAAIVPVADHLADSRLNPVASAFAVRQAQAQPYPSSNAELTYNGVTVRNVYPYDRRGRLLHDVRLYGDDGQSLDYSAADPTRRAVETRSGLVLNAFPVRYFDPGTGKVRRPDAGPKLDAPPLETPPLK
jgi:hypothetical protein